MPKACVALAALVLGGVGARALAAPDPFDFNVANVVILQDRRVQNELGITEAQRNKMNVFAKTQRDSAGRVYAAAQKGKQKDLSAAQKAEIQRGFLTLRTGVLNVLNPGQLRRLRELTVRAAGTAALLDVNIGRRLNITPAQRKTLGASFTDGQRRARGVQEKVFAPIVAKYKAKKPKDAADMKRTQLAFNAEMKAAGQGAAPALREIEATTAKRMLAAVTPAQRAGLEALKGKAFAGK